MMPGEGKQILTMILRNGTKPIVLALSVLLLWGGMAGAGVAAPGADPNPTPAPGADPMAVPATSGTTKQDKAKSGAAALPEGVFTVVDPLTGVALGGYDPISYFDPGEPHAGRPEFAYEWGGVPWYFTSAANRDAFARAPETYAPQFGGYGAMGVARGFLAAGNPRIYAVLADHLFLFYSTGNRAAFLMAPRDAYKAAEEKWPALVKDVVPHVR